MDAEQTNADLPHLVDLVLGDWSNDGHGLTETITVRCNLTPQQLEDAYNAGVEQLGLDVEDDVARDYEDPFLYFDQWEKLAAKGMTLERLFAHELKGEYASYLFDDATEFLKEPVDDEGFQIDEQAYVELWLFTASLGDPSLKWEVTEDDSPHVRIGGYGLFSP